MRQRERYAFDTGTRTGCRRALPTASGESWPGVRFWKNRGQRLTKVNPRRAIRGFYKSDAGVSLVQLIDRQNLLLRLPAVGDNAAVQTEPPNAGPPRRSASARSECEHARLIECSRSFRRLSAGRPESGSPNFGGLWSFYSALLSC
jgi:hypothetical protein